MNNYTIYCTKAQTKKALELGAPIEEARTLIEAQNRKHLMLSNDRGGFILPYIPTAEQMIGWLEEQGLIIEIYECNGYFFFAIFHKEGLGSFASRKEATLAAIDAALEYLKESRKNENKR